MNQKLTVFDYRSVFGHIVLPFHFPCFKTCVPCSSIVSYQTGKKIETNVKISIKHLNVYLLIDNQPNSLKN